MDGVRVGARFFLVEPRRSRQTYTSTVEVTKLGRKWATIRRVDENGDLARIDYGRFDIATGRLDGGHFSSPGRVWNDEAEYREHMRAEGLWADLNNALRHRFSKPDGLTAIDILKAADILGFRLKGE